MGEVREVGVVCSAGRWGTIVNQIQRSFHGKKTARKHQYHQEKVPEKLVGMELETGKSMVKTSIDTRETHAGRSD